MITVPQVGLHLARTRGLDITSHHNWSVGATIRDLWIAENDKRAIPDLHPKTSGNGGSHYINEYPDDWWSRIEDHFLALKADEAAQLVFDFDPPRPAP